MLKKLSYAFIITLCVNTIGIAQSNWSFVGPYSENVVEDNKFETSQMNGITADPSNPLHLVSFSTSGGLWESNDRGAFWTRINNIPAGLAGVADVTFKSASEIIVANICPIQSKSFSGYGISYSNGVLVYNFISSTWQSLAALPAGGSKYVITSVKTQPNNASIIYVGTSIGLFKSVNNGASWSLLHGNCFVENVLFIQKSNLTDYFLVISGSNAANNGIPNAVARYASSFPMGSAMLKSSADYGATFTDHSSSIVTAGSVAHTKIAIGPRVGNTANIYCLTSQNGTATRLIHNGIFSLTGGFQSCSQINTVSMQGGYSKFGLIYDENNNFLWLAGVGLYCYDLNTSTTYSYVMYSVHTRDGFIHGDITGFCIQTYQGQTDFFVSNDGGLAKASLNNLPDPYSIYFDAINNGIHVCLINGFSGSADEPNLYAIGGQDIVNTDIYDANTHKNRYTHETWENDGAIIDKYNSNLMILDDDSYNSRYRVSLDKGATLGGEQGHYLPSQTGPFEANLNTPFTATATNFGSWRFKQDPYRPGRIFSIAHAQWPHFMQYDYTKNVFALKMLFNNYYPNVAWHQYVSDLSFSPQTINSLHVITSNRFYPFEPANDNSPSRVFKYIGDNIDDCWSGHNDVTTATGAPQWLDITPDYFSLSNLAGGMIDMTATNVGQVSFVAIETSPWNKDLIYVAAQIYDNPTVKVMKYNGQAWSNYSTGISSDEHVISMTMDHASNDGIYLSTNRSIYYRDATMSAWVLYNTNLPALVSTQMEINYNENTVRAGTYGTGIWKSQLQCPSQSNINLTGSIPHNVYEANTITASGVNIMLNGPTALRGTSSVTLLPGFQATANSTSNNYCLAYIHGCASGTSTSTFQYFRTSDYDIQTNQSMLNAISSDMEITISPNPNNGIFIIDIEEVSNAEVEIFDVFGKKVKSFVQNTSKSTVDLSKFGKGIYLISIIAEGKIVSKKVVIE